MSDVFDLIAPEIKEVIPKIDLTDNSESDQLRAKIFDLQKKIEDIDRRKKEAKIFSELQRIVKNEVAKIEIQNKVVERIVEKQPIIKNIHVPVPIAPPPAPVQAPIQNPTQIIKEVRVEVPIKDTRKLVEESALDLFKEEISLIKKDLSETRRMAESPIVTGPGGSGVIGIPAPEQYPDGYVLTIAKSKAAWKLGTGGGMSIGGSVVSGTENSILFIGSGSVLDEDNPSFTYTKSTQIMAAVFLTLTKSTYTVNDSPSLLSSTFTTTRSVTGTSTNTTRSIYNRLIVSDSISFTSGKSASTSNFGINSDAYNVNRVLSGSISAVETVASFYSEPTESGNSITHSGSLTSNRYSYYGKNVVTETLNNATLAYTGNYYGGYFQAGSALTNTSSSSKNLTLYGVYGLASVISGTTPDTCFGGYFVGQGASSNYGAYLQGVTAAAYCNGHILYGANNIYTLGNSSNRASNIYSVLGNFSSDVTIDGALDHNGTTIGFYGVTPVARSSTYSVSNVTTDRSIDADSTSMDELADVLATLISDLKLTGIIG